LEKADEAYMGSKKHDKPASGPWEKEPVVGRSFHQISVKHLHRCLSEFQFKWNHRKAQDIIWWSRRW
jgi:hypothetical protein